MSDQAFDLRGWLAERPRVLDGAMGTELERRGACGPAPLWSAAALLDRPQTVRDIHAEYVTAGADILVANTFRTNPRTLRAAEIADRGAELNQLAVNLAREAAAAASTPVLVGASVAPVEDCYRPELAPDESTLREEHRRNIEWIAAAAPDLVWIETISTVREARAAAVAAAETGLPFVCSFVTREDGKLLSGEPLVQAIVAVVELDPVAIGLNCIPPTAATAHLAEFAVLAGPPIITYAHIGNEHPLPGWSVAESASPEQYAQHARAWMRHGARIVGGCCGTTPAHVAAVARLVRTAIVE